MVAPQCGANTGSVGGKRKKGKKKSLAVRFTSEVMMGGGWVGGGGWGRDCEGERSDSGLQREHSVRESGTQVYYTVL